MQRFSQLARINFFKLDLHVPPVGLEPILEGFCTYLVPLRLPTNSRSDVVVVPM